jgi:hypothetical protein
VNFAAGLDLGQQNDYSALVLVERIPGEDGWQFHVRHIARWRGRPYTLVVDEVGRILSRDPLPTSDLALRVDATGLGRAVMDVLRQAHAEGELPVPPQEITITSGEAPGHDGRTVPKRDLVSHLEVLLAKGRLHVAEGLRLAKTLLEELANFEAKVSASGHATYEAGGSGKHDDLVTAVCLAVWRPPMLPEAARRARELMDELRSGAGHRQGGTYSGTGLAQGWGRYGISRETNG